jgi:hypothetical protein
VNNETQGTATTGTLSFATNATATSNVGSYLVTGSGLTANNGNYLFVQAAGNRAALTVTPAALNVVMSKTYDGTAEFSNANSYTITGAIANDPIPVIVSGTATTSSANAATYTSFAANGLLLNNANYTFNGGNVSAVINRAPLGLSVNAIYSGTTEITPTSALVTGLVNNETLIPTTLVINGKDVVQNTTNYVRAITSATGSATLSNYSLNLIRSFSPGNLQNIVSLTEAVLTGTGTQTYSGTVNFAGHALIVTGVNGETFTASGSASLSNKNVQNNQQLSDIVGITLVGNAGASLLNYQPFNVSNTSVSVTPKTVTLTAPIVSKVYDGGYTYNMTSADLSNMSSQLVGGDTVSAASVVFTGNNPNVGLNKSLSLQSATLNDGNGGNNYNVSYAASTSSQITPATLSITAANAVKFVGQSDPIGYKGVLYNGWVNGEDSTALSGTLTIARSSPSNNSVGTYTLTPSGLSANNGNYAINYLPGNFTVVGTNTLVLNVTSTTATYGAAPIYTVSAQYLQSDGVTVTSLSPSISGNVITLSNGGGISQLTLTPLLASLSGSGNTKVGAYNLAAANQSLSSSNFNSVVVAGSLSVTPLSISVSELGVSGLTKVYNGSAAISALTLDTTRANSRIAEGDIVTVTGTGYYANANVGTNKTITVNVGLSGADASNYKLSSTQLVNNTGTISMLESVTYTGPLGGLWSDSNNWAGGALPILGNVGLVVIPNNKSVIYDSANLTYLTPTSTINNNGVLSINGTNPTFMTNAISGSGALSVTGVGVVTLTGSNTFSGGITIGTGSTLIAGSSTALGTGTVTSVDGSFGESANTILTSLTINGPVNLISDIRTHGSQTYNGIVTGKGTELLLTAGTSSMITFGDRVGTQYITFGDFLARTSPPSITNLTVTAGTILIKGDITTFGTQTYNGAVLISDNGSNGMTRTLLSEDPAITFNGTVNDSVFNTHNLIVKAISLDPTQIPVIDFNGSVSTVNRLASLTAITGIQDQSSNQALYSSLGIGANSGTVNINGISQGQGNVVLVKGGYLPPSADLGEITNVVTQTDSTQVLPVVSNNTKFELKPDNQINLLNTQIGTKQTAISASALSYSLMQDNKFEESQFKNQTNSNNSITSETTATVTIEQPSVTSRAAFPASSSLVSEIMVRVVQGADTLPIKMTQTVDGFSFTIPAAYFLNKDQSDTLKINTLMADGSPLPSWIKFDAETLTFTAREVPSDFVNLTIAVQILDGNNVISTKIIEIQPVSTKTALNN